MMHAVADVKAQPLGKRQIPECRVLDEQVVTARRKQFSLEWQEAGHAVAELPFHRAGVRPLGGSRRRGSLAPRRHPPQLQGEKIAEPLTRCAGSPSHRWLAATRLERAPAEFERDREMLHDLRRAPLPRRSRVPVALRAPGERAEHEIRNAGEVGHLSTASASWRACAAAGDPGVTRPTSAPALSATTRSASRTAALSVRTDNAHWWLAATVVKRPISWSTARAGR